MQLQTILKRLQRHQSFVYRQAPFWDSDEGLALDVAVQPRANGRPIGSGCGQHRPGDDRLPTRRFPFVPLYTNPLRLSHLVAFRLGRPSMMLLTLCRMVWK